jgi:archaellum component FlaC
MMTFKFLVPSIPEGTYTIRVVTSVSGETTVVWAKNTSISYIVVKPKLLLVTLDSNVTGGTGVLPILVGPGVVRVIGTGFTPGVSFDTILVNMTDAFRPIYTNVRYWSVDSNGILIGGKVEDKDIYPAILFQVLQPGKYEVRLTYYYGTTLKLSEPGYIYVVNNLTYVATKEDVDKLSNDINAGFTTISGKLDTILGKFGTVLDNITLQLNSISTGISDLKSSVSTGFSSLNGTISTGFTTISGKLDDVSKSISDVASKVGSIGTQLNTVYGLILSQGGKVDTILSLVNDIHTNMTYAMIKLDKIDAIVSKLSDISTSLSTISSSINALSGKLDDVKSAVNSVSSGISDLSSKVAGLDTKITGLDSKMDSGFKGLEAKITSLDSKVDTRFNEVSSKVDSASGAASNSMYIGVIATFFALLAMVFALLGYSTIRKSVVPK